MNETVHDVMVIGAGPAGATAAILLAEQGHKVVLVDRNTFPLSVAAVGWLNVRAAPLLGQLGVPIKTLLDEAFSDVTFHSADFSKSAKPSFEEAAGYLIDRAKFANALLAAAKKGGVSLVHGSTVKDITSGEQSVSATLEDGRVVVGRLVVFAAGRGSPLVARLGLTPASRYGSMWTAMVDVPLKKKQKSPRVDVVLGVDKKGSFGVSCVSKSRLCVSINWLGDRERTINSLINVCKGLCEQKVLPMDVSQEAARARVTQSPASAALDMDTHVGKHCLLIGDAGGFISAASNEGIYPAMWSAQIAVEVIDAALKSAQSQDELMSFEMKWRTTMADYLRSPNTDIQFLLPLIFSNQPIADRMGAAFFSGENI